MKMFILLSAVILVACTTTKYVPIESVKVDSVYVAKAQRDSIFERDSVYVAVKADTVFFSRVQYRYRDRILRDTVCVLSIDTISKIVEVEKRLTFWQQKKMQFGTVAMWLLPLLVGVFLFRKL
ncbi:MAG: hypothetical protein II296_02175 [Bacteroidaceae bacterium]|nr:hypothetical protein [Bacteroidaceae bacterium]MBQ5705880.1 hypothetical protein [Bacteroidaceae bacterium]MBQ5817172.1 hypothetical protein [Bacteroidaceae bacterium]